MPKPFINLSWTPLVAFSFQVSFLRGVLCNNVSFSEVRGLDIELEFDESGYPTKTKHPDLVLKRAMYPIPDLLSIWIKQCINFDGFIYTCDVVICLLNEYRIPVAVWHCTNAYPKKVEVSPFDAVEGKLVMETLTLTYDNLKRII